MHYFTGLCMALLLLGCGSEAKKEHYNGRVLLEEKCAVCHNLKMPPDTYEDEKAPPMMAVVFHLKDFMKINNDQDKVEKFIPFIQDYVIDPSKEKSYCDEESLKTYGVMPSQKGNVSQGELEAIAEYMYTFYDQQKFLKEMQAKAAFDALPKGEQLAVKNGCYNCHDTVKDKVGPSFRHIAHSPEKSIIYLIQNGSQGKWKAFHNVMMPPYKEKFSKDELEILQQWIDSFATIEEIKPWSTKNAI
jgi:cytochrome c